MLTLKLPFLQRRAPAPGSRLVGDFDAALLAVAVALLAFGLVMVYSATIALPDSRRFANYAPTHFLFRHLIALGMGGAAGLLVFHFMPVERWRQHSGKLFLLGIALLVVVLVPGLGKVVYGARRWISLGVMNLQPSELMKLFTCMYAAAYTVRKQDWMHSFGRGFVPMGIATAVVGLLLMLEPDLGALIVITAIAMGVLFLGGVQLKIAGGLMALLVGIFGLMIWLSPFRRARMFAYLDPFDKEHALGAGYQLSHSLIAFGRGEWFGVGLGGSVEKLHYLPEAHTDFLLAVVGEELGFVGVMVVIGLFLWFTRRCFEIGRQAIALDRSFAGLLAQGIGIWIGFQAFFNMGVNLGLLPTKGLTLPFMSYGGSGVLVNCIALAVVLRVDYESRALMRGGRA